MLSSVLDFWNLANLGSRFYMLLSSVASWIVIVVTFEPTLMPMDLITGTLHAAGVSDPPALAAAEEWITGRRAWLTPLVGLLTALALWQSAVQVDRQVNAFDKVRGPATLWLAMLIIAQAWSGYAVRLAAILLTVLVIGVVVTEAVLVWRKANPHVYRSTRNDFRVIRTLGMLQVAAFFVPLTVVSNVMNLLGGVDLARRPAQA